MSVLERLILESAKKAHVDEDIPRPLKGFGVTFPAI